MTQVVLMQRQTPDQSSVLVGREAKNSLLTSSNNGWEEIAGLSWIFMEDSG